MKKLFVLLMGVGMFAVVACGPSKAEIEAAEKAKQDSIEKAETARMDSIAAAELVAAKTTGKKPAVKKVVKKEEPKTEVAKPVSSKGDKRGSN